MADHISASKIGAYLACPRQYRFRYVDRIPEPRRAAALAFGSAIHAGLAAWYGAIKEHGDPSPGLMWGVAKAAYEDSWRDAVFAGVDFGDKTEDIGASADEMGTKGLAMLEEFDAKAQRPDEVLAVEHPFECELSDPETGEVLPERLVGYMDAVVRYGDTLAVLEHKTGARRWTDDQVANNLQCTLYHMAAEAAGFAGAEVHVQLLTKTKQPALAVYRAERGARHYRDAMDTICGVLRAASAGADYPVRDWHCAWCAYRDICAGE